MNGYEFTIWALAIFFGYGAITAVANAWRDKPTHSDKRATKDDIK